MSLQVHVFTSPADKFFVNSFLIETDHGVVVIDTQFLVSTAQDLSKRLDAIGKPLAAVVITHPHPDHYNGLPVLMQGRSPVPVYANAATIQGIRAMQAEKRAAWTPVYGADYPTMDGLPDHEVANDATLHIAGAELRFINMGASECEDLSMIHLPQANALVASDLIYNGAHPWLAEHRTSAWLDKLDEAEARFGEVETVYPGHGATGTVAMFDEQRRYINDFRDRVRRVAVAGEIPDDELASIVAETKAGREGWPLEGLVEMNARAVAQELAMGS